VPLLSRMLHWFRERQILPSEVREAARTRGNEFERVELRALLRLAEPRSTKASLHRSRLGRPFHAREFLGQLLRVNRIDKRKVHPGF
jgi:hypothetical protein